MGTERISELDRATFAAVADLELQRVPAPAALILSSTGVGLLPSRLSSAGSLALGGLEGTPTPWGDALLHWGRLGDIPVWILGDESGTPRERSEAAWTSAFPVWLAAAAGATALVATSACCSLDELDHGTFAFASDHIDLDGSSPLRGLGESRLGPMFPDQTRVHDPNLRAAAHQVGARLGLATADVVVACTPSPGLETPAEQRWHRAAGADVSVQGLLPALHAAAHAGLGTLALAVVVARAGEVHDVGRIAAAARALAPSIDDFLVALAQSAEAFARRQLEGDPE